MPIHQNANSKAMNDLMAASSRAIQEITDQVALSNKGKRTATDKLFDMYESFTQDDFERFQKEFGMEVVMHFIDRMERRKAGEEAKKNATKTKI